VHTLSARASVTTNSSAPAAAYSCRLSAPYSCQLTVSVSDSSHPLSVGASARGDDTRGGDGEECGGAAAAAARSSHAASLHAGSCCCQTTPPARPQLAVNSMCCEKTVGLTSLLAFVNRRLTWAHPTLHDRIYSSSLPVWFLPKRTHTRREGGRIAPEVTAPPRRRAAAVCPADRACRRRCLALERRT
jgi:hypothetical protein